MTEKIRRATPEDAADITDMIHGLAEFERAADQCTVTETQIPTALFGDPPRFTGTSPRWTARSPRWRCGSSASPPGTASRASTSKTCSYGRHFAAAGWPVRCWRRWRPNAANGYTRLSWAVLNWNSDAIALYDGIGAQPQREWTTYRLSGPGWPSWPDRADRRRRPSARRRD